MTAHPIDFEALRREALGQLGLAAMDPRWPGRVLIILDALAAAEHRATRADERIKAVRDVLDRWQIEGRDPLVPGDAIRRALDG